jgi:hypothetical protein
MKRLETWSRHLNAALFIAACQAPEASFFDRPLSLDEPSSAPATMASDSPQATSDGASEPAGSLGMAPNAGDSPASSSTSSPPPPSGIGPSPADEDVLNPGSNEPEVPPLGDGAEGPAPPPCTADACVACRDEERCADGLVCHPQQGLCVTSCSSDAACDAASGTPICAGNDETVLGICVECEADPDCASDDLPACNVRGVCVECTTNEHCDPGSEESVCDAERGLCVECVTDADCDADNPVCLDGECEEEG